MATLFVRHAENNHDRDPANPLTSGRAAARVTSNGAAVGMA
jgi:hypothetical protein